MNPRVKKVQPNPDYTLTLEFADGCLRLFDMKPYLEIGVFRELKDIRLFNSVKPILGSIQWKNGQDLCPDTLYEASQPVRVRIRRRSESYRRRKPAARTARRHGSLKETASRKTIASTK